MKQKIIRLTENDLHRILENSVKRALLEAKKPVQYLDLSVLDDIDYLKDGDIKHIIRAIVRDINSKNGPFTPIHKLVKFFDKKRNHVGGKSLIYGFLSSKMPNYDFMVGRLNDTYAKIIELANANYGGFQKLDQFNQYLMEMYEIVGAFAAAIKESGITQPGSNITAINGGNNGKDIGIGSIVFDAQRCLIEISNISAKIEGLIKKGKDPFSYSLNH